VENGFSDPTELVELPSELPRSRHYLLVFERDVSIRVFKLAASEVIIGRGGDAALQLQDISVSRRHARITHVHGGVQLEDLDSQNGTLLNDQRVREPRLLAAGDTIAIGVVALVYHSNGPHHPSSAQPAHFRPLAEEIRDLERARITAALTAANGNQRAAAQLLGMPLRTFVFKLKQYGLRRLDER
jgi:pSer/pThr/pTyr-binding forkhead associated (FHA) protein